LTADWPNIGLGTDARKGARAPVSPAVRLFNRSTFVNEVQIMNTTQAQVLRGLLETQQIASLGTLHDGAPYVSMVPFALLPGGQGFVIHVSHLATHTQDMLSNPAVSLLIVAPQEPGVPVQALARATIQGHARPCAVSDPGHAEAKRVYLSRFPQSNEMFSFADFSLFTVAPRTVRFVGGFAQAATVTAETLAGIMSEAK
jgi:putative heme iron utilization protein